MPLYIYVGNIVFDDMFCSDFPNKGSVLRFLLSNSRKLNFFLKIFPEKFCQFGKKQYLCTRFRKNGGRHHMEEGKKKEFFDKIYINRK